MYTPALPAATIVTGLNETVSESFTRASRLTQQAEFRRVFARPRVSQDRYFRVLGRCNDLGYPRLGLAVSVKVCKRATGRNRLKRLVRESFRTFHAPAASHRPAGQDGGTRVVAGIDMVVLPSRDAATMCNKALSEALSGHWEKQQRLARDAQKQQQGKN